MYLCRYLFGQVVLYSAMRREGEVQSAFLTGEAIFRHVAERYGSPANVFGVVYDDALERRIRAGVLSSHVVDPAERTRCLAQLASVLAVLNHIPTDVIVSITWSIMVRSVLKLPKRPFVNKYLIGEFVRS